MTVTNRTPIYNMYAMLKETGSARMWCVSGRKGITCLSRGVPPAVTGCIRSTTSIW